MRADLRFFIDVDGTLLDRDGKIHERELESLVRNLEKIRESSKAGFHLVTGNSHEELERVISSATTYPLLKIFDENILENGSVVSMKGKPMVLYSGKEGKRLITRDAVLDEELTRLYSELAKEGFEKERLVRRRATLRYIPPETGKVPAAYSRIKEFLKKYRAAQELDVSHSRSFVDIGRKGYTKKTGKDFLSRKNETSIGIGDNRNDLEILASADYAFFVANVPEYLVKELSERGAGIRNIGEVESPTKGRIVILSKPYTQGVNEALEFVYDEIIRRGKQNERI